ncbi:hypothetical protein AK812_SmicGene18477 [Symbiodinium microadriaticum]|uniref:Uncharacterized protein n=1 Tax=Symbiodinium microadriaticum TaxID=2951 RepID=A0A1Q9DV05_SYMMI|nr:hypothetical protein AK812_SmicGene18477 [Symbiodinium microadriaticum]
MVQTMLKRRRPIAYLLVASALYLGLPAFVPSSAPRVAPRTAETSRLTVRGTQVEVLEDKKAGSGEPLDEELPAEADEEVDCQVAGAETQPDRGHVDAVNLQAFIRGSYISVDIEEEEEAEEEEEEEHWKYR